MYACWQQATGAAGTRVLARDIAWALPDKCERQYDAVGYMVGSCKEDCAWTADIGGAGHSLGATMPAGAGAAAQQPAERRALAEQQLPHGGAGQEATEELEDGEGELELPQPARRLLKTKAPTRRAARRLAWSEE